MSEHTETAILAGGCFWPAQELMRQRPGVPATRVGYTGGQTRDPTADDHPGHAEAVVGSDYRSEIFCTTNQQRQLAHDTIAAVDAAGIWPGKAVTMVSEAGHFWAAEADDQDYLRYYPDGNYQFNPKA